MFFDTTTTVQIFLIKSKSPQWKSTSSWEGVEKKKNKNTSLATTYHYLKIYFLLNIIGGEINGYLYNITIDGVGGGG